MSGYNVGGKEPAGGGWGNRGNKSRSKGTGIADKIDAVTGFGLGKTQITPESMTLTGSNLKSLLDKNKPTEGGSKPASDVQKAVLQDQTWNNNNSNALDAAQTLLGMMPSNLPMGAAFGLGRWMNKKVNEDAMMHPENYKTIPGMPGGVESISGPKNANRAIPGPSAKNTEASADEETKRKRQKPLPTLLGAPAQALGTFSNPVMIT